MDFRYTEDQLSIQAIARDFAQNASRRSRPSSTNPANSRSTTFARWASSA